MGHMTGLRCETNTHADPQSENSCACTSHAMHLDPRLADHIKGTRQAGCENGDFGWPKGLIFGAALRAAGGECNIPFAQHAAH